MEDETCHSRAVRRGGLDPAMLGDGEGVPPEDAADHGVQDQGKTSAEGDRANAWPERALPEGD